MRVGVLIFGSRGDLQPFVALTDRLTAEGHEVVVGANADAAALIGAAGVKFVPVDLDTRQFLSSPAGQHALMDGSAPALLDSGNAWFAESLPSITEAAAAVADGADVVISGFPMDDYAAAVCAARGIPLMLAAVHPWEPTSQFPHPLMHPDWLGAEQFSAEDALRTHRELEQIHWRGKHAAVNRLRESLGLPPADHPVFRAGPEAGMPVLNMYSPTVVPRPADWGRNSVVTGYWQLSAQARERLGESAPPQRLVDWLEAGPAPIFLGFGSMPILDPAPVVEMAVTAAKKTGTRILIGAGWTQMAGFADSLPDYAEVIDSVDHDWLFPRCQGVVQHGGSGTTGTALAAGCPTFVFSMFLDQPFWGSRVTELGVGGHRRFPELGLDALTEAMALLSREDVHENAAAIGRRIRQEDGVETAMRVITDPQCAVVPR